MADETITPAALAAEIRASTFSPCTLRLGYAMGPVDVFLDRLADTVERGEPVADLVDGARFTPTRRHAYDMAEVDTFLERVVAAAAGTPQPPAAAPDVAPRPAADPPAPPGDPVPSTPAELAADQARVMRDAVVQEQKGFWARRRDARRQD